MLQKTFIAVDETGTTAAAVTGGGIGCSAPSKPEPYSFYMNRPFLYAIVKGDTILFMGRFVNPN
jgi:serine protease inhibitor